MNDVVADGVPMDESTANPASLDVGADSNSSGDSDSAEELEKARAVVLDNPRSFEAHVNLVRLLRTENLVELRAARRNFCERFSLPALMWMEWLEDEERFSSTPDEWDNLIKMVMPSALSDYASVEVALFCINMQGRRLRRGDMDLSSFVLWFETSFVQSSEASQVLSVAAYMYPDGIHVWKAYRNILKESNAPMDDQVYALCRQLALPLRGNSEELRIEPFDAALLRSPDLLHKVEANEEDCSMLEVFETRIMQAGSDPKNVSGQREPALLSQYAAYAAAEESRSYISAKTVWERCISEAFLCPEVWVLYGEFAKRHHTTGSFERCKPYVRAVKNVPWCLPIWVKYVQAVSALDEDNFSSAVSNIISEVEPHVMQSEDVESAEKLSMLLIVLCRKESLRIFLPTVISFNVKGSRSWANVLAFAACLGEDVIPVAEAMEQVTSAFPREALWWIRYAQMVSDDLARTIYKRAVAAIDSAEQLDTLTYSWSVFEAERTTPGDAVNFVVAQCALMDHKERILNSMQTGDRSGKKQLASSRKRPPSHLTRPPRKKPAAANEDEHRDARKQSLTGPGLASAGGRTSEPSAKTTGKPEDKGTFEPRVIYVNNLDFSVTPEELEKVFSPVGKVSQVRMPRRRDGAAKGMAYVEFDDDAAADAALSLHKMKISGREAWVRRSKPPKARHGPRHRPNAKSVQNNTADGTGPNTAVTDSQKSSLMGPKPRLRPRVVLASSMEEPPISHAPSTANTTSMEDATVIPTKLNEDANGSVNAPLKQDDFRAFVLEKKPAGAPE